MFVKLTRFVLALLALAACDGVKQTTAEIQAWNEFEKSWQPPPEDTRSETLFPVAIISSAQAFRIQVGSYGTSQVKDAGSLGASTHYANYQSESGIIRVEIARMGTAKRDQLYQRKIDGLENNGGYFKLGGPGHRLYQADQGGRTEVMWWGFGWLYRAEGQTTLSISTFLRELMRSELERVPLAATKTTPKVPGQQANQAPSDTSWVRQASYTGNCKQRPPGTTCLVFSDKYNWLISGPVEQGFDGPPHKGKKTYIVISGSKELHHVHGTDLVRTLPRGTSVPPTKTKTKTSRKVPARPTSPKASQTPSETGWVRQTTYTGNCNQRPSGTTCLVFSDKYNWLISGPVQRWIDGPLRQGKKTEIAISGPNEFHHVLGTKLVRTTRRR